jgi:hypothetical protein
LQGFLEHSSSHQCDEGPHQKEEDGPPIKSDHAHEHDDGKKKERRDNNTKERCKKVHSFIQSSTAAANSAST